jgi:hypothetical protein
VVGDFNLEPPTSSATDPNARAWAPLLADGWVSATPLVEAQGCGFETDTHTCSDFTTALISKQCGFPCWGYQLDWILYRNEPEAAQLELIEDSVEADINPLLETDCDNKQCWDEQQNAGALDDEHGVTYCSDHAALVATFKVTRT